MLYIIINSILKCFIIIIFFKFQVSLNDRFSTMVCVACVNQITTLNDIVGMSTCTNELMLKLLEKEDCVRKFAVDTLFSR